MDFVLLAFPALFSIINPLGGALVFVTATHDLPLPLQKHLARWVAIHSFIILNVSLYVGAYVLSFFGISIPVLRVAGGIVVALNGWRMLNAGQESDQASALKAVETRDASRLAFFPLTMPLTTGPGTISVAIALGTNKPRGAELFAFLLETTVTTALICAIVWVCYRYSGPVARAMGPTGTSIALRLSAFLLFCIGIQILWTGAAELLSSLSAAP